MDFDHVHPLAKNSDFKASEAVVKYFLLESQYMAAEGYVGSNYEILRKIAVRVVLASYKPENFDAFIPYLAINYFDRYVSKHGLPLPHTGKRVRDEVFLVSLSCLTIAWKMRDDFFSIPQFLEERNLSIEGEHIMEVEMKILRGFNWQMRTITPFCFVDYYVRFFSFPCGIKRQSINEIIIQAQSDIYLTQFRPSVVAASAILAASSFLYPLRYIENKLTAAEKIGGVTSQLKQQILCLDRIITICKKTKIWMETTQAVLGERENLRIQAGEPSRTAAAEAREPTTTAAAAPSSSPHKSGEEETKELQRKGKAKMQPMETIPGIQEEPSDVTLKSAVTLKLGDGPRVEISKIPVFTKRLEPMYELPLHGSDSENEPMEETSGTQKPMDVVLKRSKQKIGENSEAQQMNFKLKWITEEDYYDDLTINSPLFRPRFYAFHRGVTVNTGPDNEIRASLNDCCSIL